MSTTPSTTPTAVFIAAGEDEPDPHLSTETTHVIHREPWEKRLHEIASRPGSSFTVPRNESVKRAQVVDAVLDTFELLGGTPRMALWANENLGDFYKIYAKLAPRQLETENKHEGGITIVHVLPRGPLDE